MCHNRFTWWDFITPEVSSDKRGEGEKREVQTHWRRWRQAARKLSVSFIYLHIFGYLCTIQLSCQIHYLQSSQIIVLSSCCFCKVIILMIWHVWSPEGNPLWFWWSLDFLKNDTMRLSMTRLRQKCSQASFKIFVCFLFFFTHVSSHSATSFIALTFSCKLQQQTIQWNLEYN